MPIPETVTEEDVCRWESFFERDKESFENISEDDFCLSKLFKGFTQCSKKEVYISGHWLSEELKKLGADEQTAGECCFANGQKTAFSEDAWETAKQSLEDYKSGNWDRPGPGLADQLNQIYVPRLMKKYELNTTELEKFAALVSAGKISKPM